MLVAPLKFSVNTLVAKLEFDVDVAVKLNSDVDEQIESSVDVILRLVGNGFIVTA